MMAKRRFRSQDWFDARDHIDMMALYLERFMNYGLTPKELTSGKPIIGIAQSGSDLTPCNRIHVDLAARVQDGIPPVPESATPWQELYRATVSQLDKGGVMEMALKYRGVAKKTPRHNH